MAKKEAVKQVALGIRLYKKPGDRAELVFRKNKSLHRLGGVLGADKVEAELRAATLSTGKSGVVTVHNSRGRRWAIEVVATELKAMVIVWELLANGTSAMKFIWQGQPSELKTAF